MIDYFPIIDETIHPCRGCEDFEPLSGWCTSNGGCANPRIKGDKEARDEVP